MAIHRARRETQAPEYIPAAIPVTHDYVPAESPYLVDAEELSARGVVGYTETPPELRYLTDAPRVLRRIS